MQTMLLKLTTSKISSTSKDIDFRMYQPDYGNAQNAGETPLHYEPIDYSVDGNERNKEENPFQSATSDPAVQDGSAVFLFSSFYLLNRLIMKL